MMYISLNILVFDTIYPYPAGISNPFYVCEGGIWRFSGTVQLVLGGIHFFFLIIVNFSIV